MIKLYAWLKAAFLSSGQSPWGIITGHLHRFYSECMARGFDQTTGESDIFRQLSACLQGDAKAMAVQWNKTRSNVLEEDKIVDGAPYPYPEGYVAVKID